MDFLLLVVERNKRLLTHENGAAQRDVHMDHKIQSKIIQAWENLSEYYQERVRISTHDVHYGLLAYGEKKLNLLGNVKGKRILEVGCGGGQNTITLARWGAASYGVDPSEKQITYARNLAKTVNVKSLFEIAPAVNLPFDDAYFHVVITSYAFDFVEDIRKAFDEVYRVLVKNGIFILCLSHPYFNAVIGYLSEDPEAPDIRDYLSWPEIIEWSWDRQKGSMKMWEYLRTLSQIINPLLEKFTLERIVEQGIEDVANMSEEEKVSIPYLCDWNDKEYSILRTLPCTLIVKVRK